MFLQLVLALFQHQLKQMTWLWRTMQKPALLLFHQTINLRELDLQAPQLILTLVELLFFIVKTLTR